MELQRTFSKKYSDRLEYMVKHDIEIERYTKKQFDYDKSEVLIIPTIEKPEGLLEQMLPYANEKSDFEAARILYESYHTISRLQASDKAFWTYLCHVDLFEYIQKRFPKVLEPDFNNSTYIDRHWFYGLGHEIYHPLQGLWWDVNQTITNNPEDPYRYTRFLFKDYNLRTSFLGRYVSFRNKEQVFGILEFLMNDPELCSEHFRQRTRAISQYFNKLGATKQLISLDRTYFIDTLKNLRDRIMNVRTDEDVKNF